MEILNDDRIKQLYKHFSKDYEKHPREISTYGFLKHIVEKKLDYSVYVDSWSEYETIIIKPKDNSQEIEVYRLNIYTNNPAKLKGFLCQPSFLPQKTPIRIYGLPYNLIPVIEDIAHILNFNIQILSKDDPRHVYVLPHVGNEWGVNFAEDYITYMKNNIPEGFYVSCLDPEKDTDAVISLWKEFNYNDLFTKDEGVKAVKYFIKFGPSVGLFRRKDNSLISWIIGDIDTSMIMGITSPYYRPLRVTTFVHAECWRQIIQRGNIYWGYVASKNVKSAKRMKQLGSVEYYDQAFVHCILRPATNSSHL